MNFFLNLLMRFFGWMQPYLYIYMIYIYNIHFVKSYFFILDYAYIFKYICIYIYFGLPGENRRGQFLKGTPGFNVDARGNYGKPKPEAWEL